MDRHKMISMVIVLLFLSSVIFSCSGGGSGSGGGGGGGGNIYVSPAGNDTNPGTATSPLKTIQAATSRASGTILVTAGTYSSQVGASSINLSRGMSLYGGYSSDFSIRNPNFYTTVITDITDMSTNPYGWSAAINISGPSVIDGFTINGTTTGIGGDIHTIDVTGTSGIPTINNNIINCGVTSGSSVSRCINVDMATPLTLSGNTINVGSATWGIVALWPSGPFSITSNTINGGATSAIEISPGYGTSVIRNNMINSSATHGIYSKATSNVTIEANAIRGGVNYGIYSFGGVPVIRNNTIKLVGSTFGIYNESNSNISNNTIVGDSSANSFGILAKSALSAVMQNNIIENVSVCISENDAGSDPAVFKNNNLFGCPVLFRDEGTIDISTISGVNALLVTSSSGNISSNSALNAASDYRLSASSPITVTQGGLDLSAAFTTDKAGATRTTPWSMGAYEYD